MHKSGVLAVKIIPLLAAFMMLPPGLRAQQARFILPVVSSDDINQIQFSKDGKAVVTSGMDVHQIGLDVHEIWDVANGKYLQTINSGTMNSSQITWSDDGRYLLLSGDNFHTQDNVECWDVANHRILWKKSRSAVRPLCSISGDHLVIADGYLGPRNNSGIFKLSTGDSIGMVNTSGTHATLCRYSPDGKYLAINTCNNCELYQLKTDDSVRIYRDGEKERLASFFVGREVTSLAFGSSGSLITAITDSTVYVFEAQTGKPIFKKQFPEKLAASIPGHQKDILITHYTSHASYQSDLEGELVQVWDLRSGKCLDSIVFPHSFSSIDLKHDDTEMAFALTDSLIQYNMESRKRYCNFHLNDKYDRISSIAYSPGDTVLAAGLGSGGMSFIDLKKTVLGHYAEGVKNPMLKVRFTGNRSFITWNDHGLEHEMEGGFENFGGYSFADIAKAWSASTGKQNGQAFQGGISSARITVCASGKYLISINKNKQGIIWNTVTHQKVSAFSFNPDWEYNSFIFSSDEQKFAYTTIHQEHRLHIYYLQVRDLMSARLLSSIPLKDDGDLLGVSPHLDYAFLAPYGETQQWKIWDIAAKKIVCEANGEEIQPGYYIYNDDRELFLENGTAFTAFKKGTLYLYRYHPNHKKLVLQPFKIGRDSLGLKDVQISAGGKLIAARTDSVVYVFQTNSGHLLDTFNFHAPVDQYQFYKNESGLIAASFADENIQTGDWRFGPGPKKEIRQFPCNLLPFERKTVFISLSVSPDRKLALLAGSNGHVICYDIPNTRIYYTLVPMIWKEQFCFDPAGHFDGTPYGRSIAYYACGMKAVDFEQLKETSYEKDLVAKIMGINKAPIKAKNINQIPICQP